MEKYPIVTFTKTFQKQRKVSSDLGTFMFLLIGLLDQADQVVFTPSISTAFYII